MTRSILQAGGIVITCAFLLLLSVRAPANEASSQFRWLDRHADQREFSTIEASFAGELKPDEAEKVRPYLPMLYKSIVRIGIFGSSALVLIGERETKDSPDTCYFAFNYNMKSNDKAPIDTKSGCEEWKFKKLARFEVLPTPDIVFTFLSCTECEATYLLGSYRFDPKNQVWKQRTWSGEHDAIMIGAETQSGGEGDDTYDYDCQYKVADFEGNGFDDVAVRCVVTGETTKSVEDTTTLYSVKKGQPRAVVIKSKVQLDAVEQALCEDYKKSKLCKAR